MAGPLTSIFNAVKAVLPSTVNVFIGADAVRAEGAMPRVVFVPANEDFAGPQAQGGDGILSPPPLVTRLSNVEIHIWAATLDDTETLYSQVVQAIHGTVVGSYGLVGSQWVTAGGSSDITGFAVVLTAQFKIPITRPAETMATWSSAPTTAQMQFANGDTYSVTIQ